MYTQALFSPSTGILDSHQFMLALLGDAEVRHCKAHLYTYIYPCGDWVGRSICIRVDALAFDSISCSTVYLSI